MPQTQPMFEIRGFRGKNNVADPARILPSEGASFLAECRDADIDDELMVHKRAGFGSSCVLGKRNPFPLVKREYLPICPGPGPEKAQSGLHRNHGSSRGRTGEDGLCGGSWDRLPDQRDSYRVRQGGRFHYLSRSGAKI